MNITTVNTIIELIAFISGLVLLIILLKFSSTTGLNKNNGWIFIITGYSFILFAILVDIVEDYIFTQGPDRILKVVLEGIVGFLLGFIFLTIGFIKWIPQITTLQKAKRILKESSIDLRNRVKDYSMKLKMEKEKSEELKNQKDLLLNKVSHELRTPLNGIIGCVEIIMNTDLSEEQKQYLQRANQSSDDLLNIINNLLDFKELGDKEFVLEKKQFLIEPLVHKLMEKYKNLAANKNLNFSWKLDKRIPKTLFGSPDKIEIAVSKILENSITYTESGGINVDIFPGYIDNNKVNINFQVADTGIGIAEEYHKSIFTNFSKFTDNSLDSSSGLGLGLSIAGKFLEMMDGEITLEKSDKSKGSVFNASLIVNIVKQEEVYDY